jgi:hypothetical protein
LLPFFLLGYAILNFYFKKIKIEEWGGGGGGVWMCVCVFFKKKSIFFSKNFVIFSNNLVKVVDRIYTLKIKKKLKNIFALF